MGITLSRKLALSREGVYTHYCPACRNMHFIHVGHRNTEGFMWGFNGDLLRPSFTPSVHLTTNRPVAEGQALVELVAQKKEGKIDKIPYHQVTLCHYYLTDGQLIFTADSPNMGGQTVELPDLPQRYLDQL